MTAGPNSPPASPVIPREEVPELRALGILAFTTTRAAGTFGTGGNEPVGEVMGRWGSLVTELGAFAPRFATAAQPHGTRVITHSDGWKGWLRAPAADGHLSPTGSCAFAVTVADCVPVFLAHPSGAIALLHSGWRGTAGRITQAAIAAFVRLGLSAHELHIHLGPAICGSCYEVSPDVYAKLTERTVTTPARIDLRSLIADHARRAGARHITVSPFCTRCDNDRFFSHRAGDAGRQLGVMVKQDPGGGSQSSGTAPVM